MLKKDLEQKIAELEQSLITEKSYCSAYVEQVKLLKENTPLGILSELSQCVQATAKMVRTVGWANRPENNRR